MTVTVEKVYGGRVGVVAAAAAAVVVLRSGSKARQKMSLTWRLAILMMAAEDYWDEQPSTLPPYR